MFNKNFIYINPIFFSSDVLELNDYWLSIGYDRKIKNNRTIGFAVSTIVASQKSSGIFLGPGLNAIKSDGVRFNIEVKQLFKRFFYTSFNLFFQSLNTYCEEEVLDNSKNVVIDNYRVNRNCYSTIVKAGWLFQGKSNLYCDLNFGIGLKYISSVSIGKDTEINENLLESYSGKVFQEGTKLTYHPLLHLKIGYNF